MADDSKPGGINISGGRDVNLGEFVGGNKTTTQTAGGDIVGGDKTVGMDSAQLMELTKQFAQIKQQIKTRPEDPKVDKEEIEEAVKKIETEVKKGEEANPDKVERWLMNLGSMADDIFQVVAATLVNPAAGIGTTIRLIAQKAKEEKAKLEGE